MRQTLHIFRKDVYYLRLEAALVAVLAIAMAIVESGSGNGWWAQMLLTIAASYLIARLVHAEAIPGDRQFWLTRPYQRGSLLAAKLIFVLVFVTLPFGVAQFLIVMAAGFPIIGVLPGLLWSQAVVLAAIILPMMALAAVTAGLVPFVFIALILVAAGFSTQQMVWLLVYGPPADLTWPVSVEWVREAVVAISLTITAAGVLYVQYRTRRTALAHALAAAGISTAAIAYFYLPANLAFAMQARLSEADVTASTVTVFMDPGGRISRAPVPGRGERRVQIRVPVMIHSEERFVIDQFETTFQDTNGRTWTSTSGGVNRQGQNPEAFEATAMLPPSLTADAQDRPLTVRGTIWLTVFRDEASTTVRLIDGPVHVMDGLQCYAGAFNYLWCRSAFRWPKRLIQARVSHNDVRPVTLAISYSPFPGGAAFNPMEARWAAGSIRPDQEITIVAQKPVAHLRRDFYAGTFRVSELAIGR